MATDICLPVVKFSHAEGVRPDSTIPWTHIVAENLYVIVTGDAVTVPGGKLSMRVVQGTAVLESVNLGDCIDQATVAHANAIRNGMTPSLESLPIFGLTKDTALAIRYRLGDSKPRRVQLRMQSIVDCRQLLNTLRQRGLEFQHQHPGTSRSTGSHLRPESNESQPLIVNSQPGHGLVTAPSRPHSSNPFHMPDIEAGSFSQQQSFRALPQHVSHVDSAANATAPLRHLNRDTSLALRNPLSYSTANVQEQPGYSAQDSLFSSTQIPVVESMAESHLQPVDRSADPRNRTSFDYMTQQSTSNVASIHPNLASSGHLSARPWTSVSATTAPKHLSQCLEHELPPRRELPFKRRDSRREDGILPKSRPSSSAMALPPLPKPKLARDVSTPASSTTLMSARERDASSLEKDTRPSLSTHVPTKKALPMNELLWGTKRTSEQLSREFHREAPVGDNEQPIRDDSLAQRARDIQLPGPPSAESDSDSLKNMHAALLNSVKHVNSSALEVFARQSNEERRAALDAFMIDKLRDPNFITLCEDVEDCWRRIGFG